MRIFLEHILSVVEGLGFLAPFAFFPIYFAATLVFVPTFILALAAGAMFGVPLGFVVALMSSLGAASGGFFAGRYLSREWVLKKIELNKNFRALDHTIAKKGWKFVLLLRLSAILPFAVLNYGLGLSKISFKHYFLASLAGMIPGTLLYVYLGALAGKMVFETVSMQKTPLEWVFVVLGVSVTIVLGVYSAIVVKKALRTSL